MTPAEADALLLAAVRECVLASAVLVDRKVAEARDPTTDGHEVLAGLASFRGAVVLRLGRLLADPAIIAAVRAGHGGSAHDAG